MNFRIIDMVRSDEYIQRIYKMLDSVSYHDIANECGGPNIEFVLHNYCLAVGNHDDVHE